MRSIGRLEVSFPFDGNKGPDRGPDLGHQGELVSSMNFNFGPTVKFRCYACGKAMRPTDAACPNCKIRGAPELVNEGIAAVALPIILGIAIAGTIVVALMLLTGS